MNPPPATILPFPVPLPEAGTVSGEVPEFSAVRDALATYRGSPADPAMLGRLQEAVRAAAEYVLDFPRRPTAVSHLQEVLALVRELAKSGVHDLPVQPEDLARADHLARRDWRGILGAMLLVPAWQWPGAPVVAEVPVWLRSDFVRWLFTSPWNFHQQGQAEDYARIHLHRLEELMRWLKRLPDAKEEVPVLGAYASHSSLVPCVAAGVPLGRQAELRGRLLLRFFAQPQDHYRAPLRPRHGRSLRVGIIHRHFTDNAATASLRRLLAGLDPQRCEILLFAYVSDFGEVEDACRCQATEFRVLPQDLKAQLKLLRESSLDVVLLAEDLTADCTVVTRLALHRVAPLQVCLPTRAGVTGFPEIDLRLSTDGPEPALLTAENGERVAILPRALGEEIPGDIPTMPALCSRLDFGLSEEAKVYVSVAPYDRITPEVRANWARVVGDQPGSSLLLHPFGQTPPPGEIIMQFYQSCEDAFRTARVDPARLVVSTVVFESAGGSSSLLALGDVRLELGKLSNAVIPAGSPRRGAFGQMLECAYDELLSQGPAAFRANRVPLSLPSDR